MAEADTRRMSSERKQREAHPRRPRSASKPGTPSSATTPRRGGKGSSRRDRSGSSGSGGGRSGGGRSGGAGNGSAGRGAGASGRDETKHSLPGGGLSAGLGKLLPSLAELSLPHPHLSIWTRLAGKLLKRLARHELKKLANAGARSLGDAVPEALDKPLEALDKAREALGKPREALDKPREALDKPREALEKSRDPFDFSALRPALPVQEAVDLAVPLDFAWQKWMELSFLPEGVDKVVDIDRYGDELQGRLAGDSGRSWRAEILDERDCESFAWKSTDGSDCAGLVTFHRLGDRLTRLELTLDVLPHDATDSALLLTRVADRRARRELRKFKAELEVVSPDVYANDERSSSP